MRDIFKVKLDTGKISDLVLARGITKAELCKGADVSTETIRALPDRAVGVKVAYKLATFLSVEPREIILKDEEGG